MARLLRRGKEALATGKASDMKTHADVTGASKWRLRAIYQILPDMTDAMEAHSELIEELILRKAIVQKIIDFGNTYMEMLYISGAAVAVMAAAIKFQIAIDSVQGAGHQRGGGSS